MKLTIFAATGGIGREILDQALLAGHDITAVVRNPDKLSARKIRVVAADLRGPDPATLDSAVRGAEAVLSGLGPRSLSEAGVASQGTRAMVQAMKVAKVHRIVVVSAAPIGTVPSPGRPNPPKHDAGDGFFMRNLLGPLTKTILKRHYADLAPLDDIVRESRLDWTIVRPPRLTNKLLTGTYRTAYGRNLPRGLTISRANVGHLMLRVLDEPESINQVIGIAN